MFMVVFEMEVSCSWLLNLTLFYTAGLPRRALGIFKVTTTFEKFITRKSSNHSVHQTRLLRTQLFNTSSV